MSTSIHPQVEAMVNKLRGPGHVFGYPRPQNVVFVGNKAFLIGFDWGNIYPATLGDRTTKYYEVSDLGTTEKGRDFALFIITPDPRVEAVICGRQGSLLFFRSPTRPRSRKSTYI